MADPADRNEGGTGDESARGASVSAARRRFGELAGRPDATIDLAEGALLIAAEEYPGLDIGRYTDRLDLLARRVADQLPPEGSDERAIAALHRVLFEEEGFTGAAQERYNDPRNSFLNEVLERKRGLPILLSVLYCEVARRAGLEAVGIGLPGHFIAQFRGQHLSALVDPFNGGARLDEADCAALLARAFGGPVRVTPEHLQPASRKATLARILMNLKNHYFEGGQLTKALAAVDRILMLQTSLEQVRDRGLILRRMGLLLLGSTSGRGQEARRRQQGAAPAPNPDSGDLLVAQQLLGAAWLDLMLYAREGASQPDAEAVKAEADALWRRMARQN